MRPTTNTNYPASVPLIVDLDGTLISTDTTWEATFALLGANPFYLFVLPFWLARGRAFLKQRFSSKVTLDPTRLPYNEPFVAWLKEQKLSGRRIVLATASDRKIADAIAKHVGVFDEVLASDGRTNLRDAAKLKALTEKFGSRGFDYAGNSPVDLAVWAGAREGIVVNAGRRLEKRARKVTKVSRVFH